MSQNRGWWRPLFFGFSEELLWSLWALGMVYRFLGLVARVISLYSLNGIIGKVLLE